MGNKQEIPKLGTKEFNDLASAYFGGNPKKETLEEVAERLYPYEVGHDVFDRNCEIDFERERFIEGAKWQAERMYSLMDQYVDDVMGGCNLIAKEWFEQFKKKVNGTN